MTIIPPSSPPVVPQVQTQSVPARAQSVPAPSEGTGLLDSYAVTGADGGGVNIRA